MLKMRNNMRSKLQFALPTGVVKNEGASKNAHDAHNGARDMIRAGVNPREKRFVFMMR